jgi:hypothetical protein
MLCGSSSPEAKPFNNSRRGAQGDGRSQNFAQLLRSVLIVRRYPAELQNHSVNIKVVKS